MAVDATTLLIQRIEAAQGGNGGGGQNSNASLLSQITALVGAAANYAQILGTIEGPLAQVVATQVAGGAVKATADAAGQAVALSAAAAAAGIGAGIVLIFSFILAGLAAADGSGSSESQVINQLSEELGQLLQDFTNVGLGTYWQDKFGILMGFWSSPEGGVGTDLDNLSNQGIDGVYVKADVGKFHDNALAFVNAFLPTQTPGVEIYWERPLIANQQFAAQTIKYPPWGWRPGYGVVGFDGTMGWYGDVPAPQLGPPLGGSQAQMAADPTSMLSFLLVGIQSYLSIQMLVNLIDPTQPAFNQFLQQFTADLQAYTQFIYSQYLLITNGLRKSDLPSPTDMGGFLAFVTSSEDVVMASEIWDNAASWEQNYEQVAKTGYMWNGVYGVVHTYPPYGTYAPAPPVPVPNAAPTYILDMLDTSALYQQWQQASIEYYPYVLKDTLDAWVFPWLTDRLILTRMARWKAIYLFNGYDRVWSMLQKLQFLANPSKPILPPVVTLTQDGTIASGNWSARELCTILNFDGGILSGVQQGSIQNAFNTSLYGYSVFALVQVLDNLANGNWTGPPSYSRSGGTGPTRPLSFRDRLDAVAA